MTAGDDHDAAMPIRERARAKINLTLTVHGRRADGYHELESIVAFADVGDDVTFTPGADTRVSTTGPFAAEITGGNLVQTALEQLGALGMGLRLGSVALVKNLPVAAGLGGGSADAAAVLRAVRRANADIAGQVDWHGVALRLGADVPVCLAGTPALMRGIGDNIEPWAGGLPELPVVLVNPRVPLATAHVFAALGAGPATLSRHGERPGDLSDRERLLHYMRQHGNDLERPATMLLPVIGDIKVALAAQPECRIAALSGSGPTCFGIFATKAAAAHAAAALAKTHPDWWVVVSRLAGSAE